MLHSAIFDSEQPDMDGVHDAIFAYRMAVVTLHDNRSWNFQVEAEAFSKMGQIFFNVLKNETQAREHCLQSIHLAGSIEHQNFAGKGKGAFKP